MSKIDSSIELLGPRSVLFPEEDNPNRLRSKACYDQPLAGYEVEVKYDAGSFDVTPYFPYKEGDEPFPDRNHALKQEYLGRVHWYRNHPKFDSYKHDKLLKGSEDDPKQLAFINYSAKPAYDFTMQMRPYDAATREALGFQDDNDYGKRHRALQFTNTWHHNGLPSYQFTEDGQVKTLHDTVTASNDRTAYKISMMRRVDSRHDGKSVVYTGRPDTAYKANEQVEFLFRSEMAKGEGSRQGIKENADDGTFELTYVVHNFMSAMKMLGMNATGTFSQFDELKSIQREEAILAFLENMELTINGKKVRVKPIYFNQGISALNDFGTPALQKEINARGDKKLFKLAEGNGDLLVQAAIKHLKNPESLLPEEEFFYRDLLCKKLGLPEVLHCKSSTDRTMLMTAISMATKEWMNLDRHIPPGAPHAILSEPLYRELYLSNILSGHQVTRVSRSAEGTVAGAKQFSKILGYVWGTNTFTKNYVALRMLPERFSKEGGQRPPQITITLKILKFVNWFFSSKGISQRISYLERAYSNREFKPNLFLSKPKGMKIYYPKGSVNPHEYPKKEPGRLRHLTTKVIRFGVGFFWIFSTLSSIPELMLSNPDS